LQKLIERADEIVSEKKLFLKPDFSKRDLAIELRTNRTYITEALATCRQCRWREYVASFRVKHFLKIARLAENRRLTLEGIATKCGFGSAKTLNRYLMQEYGIRASDYRKNLSTSLRAEGSAKTATLS
jgi:transcriptional regulator GlxA family with amidase domain